MLALRRRCGAATMPKPTLAVDRFGRVFVAVSGVAYVFERPLFFGVSRHDVCAWAATEASLLEKDWLLAVGWLPVTPADKWEPRNK